jgi:choline dehydrogenase-like flavoprotein
MSARGLLRGENDYPGWGWADVLPHFRGMEGNGRLPLRAPGADGTAPGLRPRHINEVSRWFVQAGASHGRALQPRLQRPGRSAGVGFYQFMNRRGPPQQRGLCLIKPLGGDNPTSRCACMRVSADRHRAMGRAVGRDPARRDGAGTIVGADGEGHRGGGLPVTPQLLMLSGVGPAEQLKQHGIRTIVDLPGVGENLIDHPEVPIISR